MYRPVPAQINLPAMEHEVLAMWDVEQIFRASLAQTAGRQRWTFYEGPPTANGSPGTHHVEARAFKDVFPRYRTMKGFHVPRQAGWDCHGLPVELAVEKELGFRGKGDIEEYGVAAFNERCRESVLRHVDEFTAMTRRMGYWVDMDTAYWTMDSDYVQSVWWSLRRIFDAGLLVQDHRVAPYCPRCGTGLSDHELAQGYEDVVDPSVYVRFPITDEVFIAAHGPADLLIWTTTPWTLVANTAVAVNPEADYVVAETPTGQRLVVAEGLMEAALGSEAQVRARMRGRELEHVTYRRPLDLVDIPDAHYIVLADYVTIADGTGLVHQAPAFGADDLTTCRAYGLPVVNPVLPDGHFGAGLDLVGGLFFKKADSPIIESLQERDLMWRHVQFEHAYPHCWRCHTPLIYYAQPSWYIRTTAIKEQLLEQNEETSWFPGTVQWGRYGDWLNNNVDWALSRNRYWGTPLPIWRCPDGHLAAYESLADLGRAAGRDLSGMDPHRPFIDDVKVPCPQCRKGSSRVPEVIDCWYDSGAMPFAALGYPHRNASAFDQQYPADFICEAIDQTRGWFYTLMAIGTLVFGESSYRNVVCLGHILDEEGRKMSKHLGNVLEPIGLMEEHGADAVRWFMLANGSPWQARRVGHAAIADVVRKTLLTYWNTVSFQALYARIAGWTPSDADPPPARRPVLDRWVLSEAARVAEETDAALATFDTQRAGRLLAGFIDDLSNWYVRRSRRRFWDGDPAALATLHEALRILTLAMAPFTPFITERVWQDLFRPTLADAARSVHLAQWPVPSVAPDPDLAEQVRLTRRLVELGRAARAESGMRTRQPLARALVSAQGWSTLNAELLDEIATELNVQDIASLTIGADDLIDVSVKANFRSLGRRFGKDTPIVAEAVASANAAELAASLRARGAATLHARGLGAVEVTAEDVVIYETPRQGWAVASGDGETVALDLELTDDLRRLGVIREIVRLVQDARKAAGLEITDRIDLWWSSSDPLTVSALADHSASLARDVLAVRIDAGPGPQDARHLADPELQVELWLRRAESA